MITKSEDASLAVGQWPLTVSLSYIFVIKSFRVKYDPKLGAAKHGVNQADFGPKHKSGSILGSFWGGKTKYGSFWAKTDGLTRCHVWWESLVGESRRPEGVLVSEGAEIRRNNVKKEIVQIFSKSLLFCIVRRFGILLQRQMKLSNLSVCLWLLYKCHMFLDVWCVCFTSRGRKTFLTASPQSLVIWLGWRRVAFYSPSRFSAVHMLHF